MLQVVFVPLHLEFCFLMQSHVYDFNIGPFIVYVLSLFISKLLHVKVELLLSIIAYNQVLRNVIFFFHIQL